MKRWWNKWMLSCKKATELIEKKKVTSLGTVEKMQLNFHKRMCKVCSAYEIQSDMIDKAVQYHYTFKDESNQEHISAEAKRKIIERLSQNPK